MTVSFNTQRPSEHITRGRKCLLSLDGGGVRGLSSILILKQIMTGINQGKKDPEKLHPWQVFDLMGGTSTGGLIAIMLGRLKMSIDDCERAYLELSEVIFQPIRHFLNPLAMVDKLTAAPRFDEKALESAIEKIVVEAGYDKDEPMFEEEPSCPVFVTSIASTNSYDVRLRSYESRNGSESSTLGRYTIMEACRATTAAKTYFQAVTIGRYNQKFIDAGVIENNPIRSVYHEAEDLWSKEGLRQVLLVSIGTGCLPGPNWEGNAASLVTALRDAATEREQTWKSFSSEHTGLIQEGQLFRLDVDQGLAAVGLEEFKHKEKIADATLAYLKDESTKQKTRSISNQLRAAMEKGKESFSNSWNVISRSLPQPRRPMTDFEAQALNSRLLRAIHTCDADLVKRLLDTGANPSTFGFFYKYQVPCTDTPRISALQHAIGCDNTDRVNIVNTLIQYGADPNHRNGNKENAFHLAIDGNHLAIADTLLCEMNVDIDAKDSDGNTALHRSARRNGIEQVRFLRRRNADKSIQNKDGRTALDLAAEHASLDLLDILCD